MSARPLNPELTGIGRVPEIAAILEHVAHARCCSLVGVSNMGKSTLLRALTQEAVLGAYFGEGVSRHLLLYVDCNRMLQLSEQGFYELVLRCLREVRSSAAGLAPMSALLEQAYADVVQPASPLAMPLAFGRAIGALLDGGDRSLTLVLDEFDDPLRALDGRVLLNLRALHDQYADRLAYVTATGTELQLVRQTRDAGADEFCELFIAPVLALGPLTGTDSAHLLHQQLASPAMRSVNLSAALIAQLAEQAGGHPGLLRAGLSCAAAAGTGTASGARWASPEGLTVALDQDPSVRIECDKLWEALGPLERRALEELARLGTSRQSAALRSLLRKGLVRDDGAQLRPFAPIWERYVRRLADARAPSGAGVRIDEAYGEVWVDGRPVSYLTPLEHRLLAALHERAGQVCTKEEIVEAVYGRAYIDSDLPALQRLVHRLRAKIEADPAKPLHVLNMRGYGYKLSLPDQS